MPTAREKLAALRGVPETASARDKLAVLRGKAPTKLLDAEGLTGAEAKRRAAAGEPVLQEGEGLRPATEGENIAGGAAAVVSGAAEGLAGTVGLAVDAATGPFRAAGAAAKAIIGGKGLRGAGEAVQAEALNLPVTRKATEAADDLEKALRDGLGVEEDVATSAALPAIRFTAVGLTPGPEFAAFAKGRKLSAENVIEFYERKAAATTDEGAKAAIEAEMRRTVASVAPPAPTKAVDVAAPPSGTGAAPTAAAELGPDGVVERAATPTAEKVSGQAAKNIPDSIPTGIPPKADGPPALPPAPADAPVIPSGELPKYAEPSSINLQRLNITDDAKRTLVQTAEQMRPELEKLRGKPLTHEEVIEDAAGADLLRRAIPRAESAKNIAQQLRTRQHLAAMLEGNQPVTAEMIERIQQVSSFASDAGRRLNAQKIDADPILQTAQTKMIQRLTEMGHKADEIVEAAKGVDFNDARQATDFYRKFVKPSLGELLDEYRYANMLSSPRTHIVNAFSNVLQVGALRPAVRLVSGGMDWLGSAVTGKARERYVSEVPAYYRGAANSVADASREALKAITGKRAVEHLDMDRIPTGSKLTAPFRVVSNVLEAGDIFFRTIAEGGELEALARRAAEKGEEVTEATLAKMHKEAQENAKEVIFRKDLDPSDASGQGAVLARIDRITGAVEQALAAVPGGRWFVPFMRTPTNILKQGIEYSPLGLSTLPRNADKTEQLAKAFIGSTVFAGAATLSLQDRTTWAVPKSAKDRAAFYAAGMQPYSVKIGDKWVSYSKLGPLAYPIAMAAGAKHYAMDAPETAGADAAEKMTRIMLGVAEFFSDQSYVQGLATMLEVPKGVSDLAGAATKTASNFATQLVPLSGLLRWANQMLDPVYRKSGRNLSIESIIDNVRKGIPFASEDLPAYKTPTGEPSKRQMPVVNAVSPIAISEEDPEEAARFRRLQAERRGAALRKRQEKAQEEKAQ